MSYHVSVGGMKMRSWSVFFRVIRMTYAALKAARAAPGCVCADIFRDGRRYFAFSVWDSAQAMSDFAHQGMHQELMQAQSQLMVHFKNHSFQCDEIPDRKAAQRMWQDAEDKRQT